MSHSSPNGQSGTGMKSPPISPVSRMPVSTSTLVVVVVIVVPTDVPGNVVLGSGGTPVVVGLVLASPPVLVSPSLATSGPHAVNTNTIDPANVFITHLHPPRGHPAARAHSSVLRL